MGERNDGEGIRQDTTGELPFAESPPLSPAGASSEGPVADETAASGEASAEAVADAGTTVSPHNAIITSAAAASRARISLSRRYQRRITLAAWVALVAGFGALFGGAVSNGLSGYRGGDVAGLEQRKAMQQSIDRLTAQVGDLKAKLVAATAETRSQVASTSARAGRVAGSDVTGSIPVARPTPMPMPRPAPPIAAAASQPAIVHSWRIVRARGGLVDVEGRDGIYEVVPGAVLPGLGRVASIERRDGRWVVVTPKGLIVFAHDRPYFTDF